MFHIYVLNVNDNYRWNQDIWCTNGYMQNDFVIEVPNKDVKNISNVFAICWCLLSFIQAYFLISCIYINLHKPSAVIAWF